jgi:hypothetical protein
MNLEDLRNARAVAGANYSAAVDRLREAYIELAALDMVSANGGIGNDDAPNVRTFGFLPQNIDRFEHPTFSPIDPATCWRDAIAARRDALLRALSKGVHL